MILSSQCSSYGALATYLNNKCFSVLFRSAIMQSIEYYKEYDYEKFHYNMYWLPISLS